jgi:fused signal recognition particle receptor
MFDEALGLTGLVLTKLDGTARGGIVVAIARELSVPVRYVGTGEGIDDFEPFDPTEFAGGLLGIDREGPETP